MPLDYPTLELLRQNHPAWRLLRSDHASLVASFLHRVFVAPNVRSMSQADLAEALEDELFALRDQRGEASFPKSAQAYLNDWAENDKGWLRKFYPTGSDEPHFDLTPATEKALAWLASLTERAFVGTESRLLTLFELLRQMNEGSETDPRARIAELNRRRAEIDGEIARIRAGDIPLLDDTALKDRFQQFLQLARELLADFREVEHNFRTLDRRVRERIALWDGAKGALLEEIMGERDAIADSDQGKSFRAFWDFLMSQTRQEELTRLLTQVLELPPVAALHPEPRLRRVHYDWLEAGENTQRTVARLSQQLRRFLDDQAWLENRRIMDILHNLEGQALAVRESPPAGGFMSLDETAARIELPLERPLYTPPVKPLIADVELEEGAAEVDAALLYGQVVVDRAQLAGQIDKALQTRSQIGLGELVAVYPLRHGLAELVTYLHLAGEAPHTVVDEATHRHHRLAGAGRNHPPRPASPRHFCQEPMMETSTRSVRPLRQRPVTNSPTLVVPLLKGVLYQEENPAQWNALLGLQARVRDYVAVLGLELLLDEAEGYAFLRSRDEAPDAAAPRLPRLVARRQLSFPVSLLLALLRKKLAEFDAGGGETRLILSRDEVVELIRVFLPAGSNETRLIDQVDAHLNKIVELGFVRRLRGQEQLIEVRRILKAFVDAQWLAEFDRRLAAYREQLNGGAADG